MAGSVRYPTLFQINTRVWLEAEIVGIGPTANRDQQMRAVDLRRAGRAIDPDDDVFTVLLDTDAGRVS